MEKMENKSFRHFLIRNFNPNKSLLFLWSGCIAMGSVAIGLAYMQVQSQYLITAIGGFLFFAVFHQIAKLSTYFFQSETKLIKDSQVSVYDLSQNLEAAKTLADIKQLKVDSEAMRHLYIEKEKALQELLIESRMQLKKEENLRCKFEFMVEVADLGFWEVNLATQEESHNERLSEIYEYSEGFQYDILTEISERIVKEDRQKSINALKAIKKDGIPFVEEYAISLPKGTKRFIERSAFVQKANDTLPLNLIVIERDITFDKVRENEMENARILAERSAEAETQFLASMSHEIRTPLNAVIAVSGLLLEENPRKDQIDNINVLNFSAQNLLNLINDILDFNKISYGQMLFENIAFNLKDLVVSVRESLRLKAEENNTLLKIKIGPRVPSYLKGDPTRLTQILLNLGSNAVKFTKSGEVSIEIKLINKVNKKNQIQFVVKDNGIGIHENKIKHIFNRFNQADQATTRKYGGTGLGLSISKELVELQGGEIAVSSIFNEGSEFFFSLFLNEPEEEIEAKECPKDYTDAFLGKKILLAEDNKINIKVAIKVLAKAGVLPEVVENGIEALEAVQKEKFDLILMDLHMPILDGIGATQEIRKLGGEYLDIPIIALTAEVLGDIKERITKAGMNRYAAKPLVAAKLFEDIHNLLYSESL